MNTPKRCRCYRDLALLVAIPQLLGCTGCALPYAACQCTPFGPRAQEKRRRKILRGQIVLHDEPIESGDVYT